MLYLIFLAMCLLQLSKCTGNVGTQVFNLGSKHLDYSPDEGKYSFYQVSQNAVTTCLRNWHSDFVPNIFYLMYGWLCDMYQGFVLDDYTDKAPACESLPS
jgi:hypothetical protein